MDYMGSPRSVGRRYSSSAESSSGVIGGVSLNGRWQKTFLQDDRPWHIRDWKVRLGIGSLCT